MSTHYHLLVETPEPNLVDGMKWFQTKFDGIIMNLRVIRPDEGIQIISNYLNNI